LCNINHVPEELRAGYILLRNAEVLPEEMQLKKEIVSLQRLINSCYAGPGEDRETESLRKKLTEKILRYDMLMEKRNTGPNQALGYYQNKIHKKLGRY